MIHILSGLSFSLHWLCITLMHLIMNKPNPQSIVASFFSLVDLCTLLDYKETYIHTSLQPLFLFIFFSEYSKKERSTYLLAIGVLYAVCNIWLRGRVDSISILITVFFALHFRVYYILLLYTITIVSVFALELPLGINMYFLGMYTIFNVLFNKLKQIFLKFT